MNDYNQNDSHAPSLSGGALTRATTGPHNDTVQPPLTSGFGAVIEKEHDLQTATEGSFGQVTGAHTAEIDRILRDQHAQLGANIALLEQRYEALPNPGRFATWHGLRHPPTTARRIAPREDVDLLGDLIARHAGLVADIETLIRRASDGQRSELILNQVGRNHEDMGWILRALVQEDETIARGLVEKPAAIRRAEENWDNEGGATNAGRPVVGVHDAREGESKP